MNFGVHMLHMTGVDSCSHAHLLNVPEALSTHPSYVRNVGSGIILTCLFYLWVAHDRYTFEI